VTEVVQAIAVLNSIGDAVLTTDLDGHVTYLNLKAETMTGWSRDAAAGRPLDDVFHIIGRESREPARDPMRLAIQLDKTVGLTPNCVLIRRDGMETAIEDSAAPIHDADGRVTGAVIVFRDVGTALETSRQMAHLAQHDPLTGLPNRLLLHDRLTEAIALGHRRKKQVAVLFLDLDGFKNVNDSLGHATGDEILKAMAARLTGALRLSDTVGRYGGDEFVVVLSEIERTEDATAVAGKVMAVVNAPYRVGTQDVAVTASVGGAVYPDHGRNADTLIANADAAMYRAKRSGPDHYETGDRLDADPVTSLVH
jgi:diguanylate cyclase (GGDEF)-like protein/PAS domain S-box-containing protein